jgi:phosphatidylglycerol:prolipoprotein diacylglycerol transferase
MKVSFPGLNIAFEMSREAFSVFGLPIYWYGIIIAFAFLAAVLLGLRSCKKFGIEPDNILDLVLFAAPAAIIGARLYFVIFSWDQYKDNLIDIVKIRDGGLAIYGGVISAILVAWLYARKKKISPLNLVDFGVPYLVLGQAIGRWGNFVNQEAFGAPTKLPWRMNGTIADSYLSNLPETLDLTKWGVHPAFLYESLWDLALFFFLIWFRRKKKLEGEVLFLYLIGYGVGRFMIESLRTDSLYLGSFRVSQLLSALLVVVFVLLFILRRIGTRRKEDEEPVELGHSQYGSLLMKLKEEEAAAEPLEDGTATQESDNTEGQEEKEEKEE